MRFPSFFIAGSLLLSGFCLQSRASTPEPAPNLPEPQMSGSLALPVWAEGEAREGFDIRIWPEDVIVWLEWDNLKDLIADPNTPEEEKQALRQILVHQKAWRAPRFSERGS